MTSCDTVNRWLDDLVDDDLGPEEMSLAEEHMRSCAGCREEYEGLRAVKEAASALPHELSPPRDLWHGIEDRLEPTRRTRRWSTPVVIAAAASVVFAIGLGFLLAPGRTTAPIDTSGPQALTAVHARHETSRVETYRIEYERARNDLLSVIESRREQLGPETLEVIDRNMRLIDQAIADIEKALASSPEEAGLDRQLQLAYRQQIDLLRWAARLSA